jgi:uncharacterized membrane protein
MKNIIEIVGSAVVFGSIFGMAIFAMVAFA